ncbi:hypothetical protein L218DRAFT_1008029 [Marasmius fiardii PR-910]|nr:hypothetical protein L218DRAFT_1008029 [Marasmius fiardii PR-910]
MARFNLALLFVIVAAWSANVAQSAPLPRASAEAGTIISMSSGNDGTSNKDMNKTTTTTSVMMTLHNDGLFFHHDDGHTYQHEHLFHIYQHHHHQDGQSPV